MLKLTTMARPRCQNTPQDNAGDPGRVVKDTQNVTLFTGAVINAAGATEKLGIVVRGIAAQ